MSTNKVVTVKKKDQVYFYPGRTEEFDWPSFVLDNIFVTGSVNSGVITWVDSMLVNLIEKNSPSELNIRYHNCSFKTTDLWQDYEVTPGKVKGIGHLSKISHVDDMYLKDLLEEILEEVESIETELEDIHFHTVEGLNKRKKKLYIINNFTNEWNEEYEDIIEQVIKTSRKTGVYIMLVSIEYNYQLPDHIMSMFRYRVCLRTTAGVSNNVIDCDNAREELMPKFGAFWIKDSKVNKLMVMFTQFYPDTFLRKFIKSFSITKDR